MFHEQDTIQQPPSKWKPFFDKVKTFNTYVEYGILLPFSIGEFIVDQVYALATQNAFFFNVCLCVSTLVTIPVTSLAVGLGVGLGVGCARTNTVYTNATNATIG